MAKLIEAPASGTFKGWFAPRPGHATNKDFNYEIIY